MGIISFIKNQVINRTSTEIIFKKVQKAVIFVKKNLKIKMLMIKNIVKLEINVIIKGIMEALHIVYVI